MTSVRSITGLLTTLFIIISLNRSLGENESNYETLVNKFLSHKLRSKRAVNVEDVTEAVTLPFVPTRTTNFGDQPILEYYQGYGGRIEYVRALIQPKHLKTGTICTDKTRELTQKLGGLGKGSNNRALDDCGHIIAKSLGGRGEYAFNVFPQTPNVNRGDWNRWEGDTVKFLTNTPNGLADLSFNFEYPDETSTRPNKYRVLVSWTRLGDSAATSTRDLHTVVEVLNPIPM